MKLYYVTGNKSSVDEYTDKVYPEEMHACIVITELAITPVNLQAITVGIVYVVVAGL
jgi:hypothetical protein